MAAACVMTLATGCSDDSDSAMDLSGECDVKAITVNGYKGEIDADKAEVTVSLPTDIALEDLRIDDIQLSAGATCDMPAGTRFNGTIPQAITVVNRDATRQFILRVSHDNVTFLSFTLDGTYTGSIDNAARTITVFVPLNTDVTAMAATYTVNEGSTVTPASGTVMDFTQPVTLHAVCNTASVDYKVTVIKDEMSQEPKAFVGTASSIDQLGDEARAACRWMIDNVPNSHYVCIQDVIDGKVRLDDYKMVWAHLDFTDWPGQMWDSRDQFNSYWMHGGALLATRDGARYINDVWRIARNQQSPNDMFGGESDSTLSTDLGFSIRGHEDHPLYKDIEADADGRILLLGAGCRTTGRTLQWNVTNDPYGSMEIWREQTGAEPLGSAHDHDDNIITVAEFTPSEVLTGFTSGRVVTIGTPAFEWNGNESNPYRENLTKLTKNAINYLCQ